MTTEQVKLITNLRNAGFGYKKIAAKMGISESTVKSHCRRNGLAGKLIKSEDDRKCCQNCGTIVAQTPGRKVKKFCSDKCRNLWWNSHAELVKRRAIYVFKCPCCKKEFTAYGNNHRKYCSHECYIRDRFGEIKQEVTSEI